MTRRGHGRLSVHRIAAGNFLWRLEEMLERAETTRGTGSVGLPMLIASKSGVILFMNDALRGLVGGRPKTLDRSFRHLPLRSGGEMVASTADGALPALVAEIKGGGERLEIYLLTASAIGEGALGPDEALFEELPGHWRGSLPPVPLTVPTDSAGSYWALRGTWRRYSPIWSRGPAGGGPVVGRGERKRVEPLRSAAGDADG